MIAVVASHEPRHSLPDKATTARVVCAPGQEMVAITIPGCDDMREFDALAQQVAEDEGIAVLALCFPSERHEVCTVYRRGRRPHTFILSGPGEDTPRHFAALGESRVTCPIGDGLEVAGLGGITASHALCSQVGQHTHGDDGA